MRIWLLALITIISLSTSQIAFGNATRITPCIELMFDKTETDISTSGVTTVKGLIGNGVQFSGAGDCGIKPQKAGIGAPATLCVWVKIGCPRGNARPITRFDGDKDQIGTIRFRGEHVEVWNGTDWKEIIPFFAVNNTWQHIAVVFGADGTATGYVNGRKKSSIECGFDFAGISFGIGTPFAATEGRSFAGEMDEYRIYDRALSGDEIKSLYSPKLYARAERADGTTLTPMGKIALQESAEPIRPGIPGVRPFWNGSSFRFIYAPAFDFKTIEGAKSYRFTVTSKTDGSVKQFEADTPTAPLSPIWIKITAGPVSLKVEGLDKTGGAVVGVAGTRDFTKSLPFNGPYNEGVYSLGESARRSLLAQFYQPNLQAILKDGKPGMGFHYATKFMAAVASGMTYLSQMSPKPAEAEDALKMARLSGDYLISLTEREGTPLAGWPPTYWNLKPFDDGYVHERIMTSYPAEAAMTYLDLYDVTHDSKYLAAAKTVADTYLRLQLKCGTWYQIMDAVSGEPTAPNLLIPTYVIRFFDRLKKSYSMTEYETARNKAFNWVMANPVKTFNWQGQFEDVSAQQPYADHSNQEVTEVAIILFEASDKHPEYLPLAKELLRFAEDQFVMWDRRDTIALPWWPVPCATEQYVCYWAISGSNRSLMCAYLAAYKATKDPIYKAKFMGLGDALTVVQKDNGGGEIPTWMNFGGVSDNWINCSVYTAMTLIDCEKMN